MRVRRPVAVLVAALLLFGQAAGAGANSTVDGQFLEAAIAERDHYGLPADRTTVESIIASGRDIGTDKWGIVLTAEEEKNLDLPGRGDYVARVHELVLDEVRDSELYAGAYVDQRNGGGIVLLLTRADPAVTALIDAARPQLSRGLEVKVVVTSFQQLEAAMYTTWDIWAEYFRNTTLVSVSVDERANALVVGVEAPDQARVASDIAPLAARLGVPATVEAATAERDLCSSRTSCAPPMKAGVRISRSANPPNHTGTCSMGFHVYTSSGGGRFVSAGHCGHNGTFWWHNPGTPGSGGIGSEQATLYGPNFSPSRDIHAVGIPTSWMTNRIFGSSAQIKSMAHPVLDESICASLGVSTDAYDCGHVSKTAHTWTSNVCACTQSGARATGVTNTGGDSGSPMVGLGTYLRAIGILAQGDSLVNGIVNFTRFRDAMNVWGYTLKTS